MLECNPIDTLMDSTTKLGAKEDSAWVDKGKYKTSRQIPKHQGRAYTSRRR